MCLICFLFPFTYYGRFNLKPSDTPIREEVATRLFSYFGLSYCELHILFFVILSSWHTSICMRLAWSIAYTVFYLSVFYSTYLDFSIRESV